MTNRILLLQQQVRATDLGKDLGPGTRKGSSYIRRAVYAAVMLSSSSLADNKRSDGEAGTSVVGRVE